MRRFFHISLGVLLCAMLGLTACGRKGPLEAPPSAAPAGQKSQDGPPNRPFILDGLVR